MGLRAATKKGKLHEPEDVQKRIIQRNNTKKSKCIEYTLYICVYTHTGTYIYI